MIVKGRGFKTNTKKNMRFKTSSGSQCGRPCAILSKCI